MLDIWSLIKRVLVIIIRSFEIILIYKLFVRSEKIKDTMKESYLTDSKKKLYESIRVRVFILSIIISIMINTVTIPIQSVVNKYQIKLLELPGYIIQEVKNFNKSKISPNPETDAIISNTPKEEIQKPIDPYVAEKQDQEIDETQNEAQYNHGVKFADDITVPLEDRVPVPEWSIFPSENMVAIDVYESSLNTGGYDGTSISSSVVTYAFTSEKDDSIGLLSELETEILHNPLVGDMIAQELVLHYPEEEWLQEFIDKTNVAFDPSYDEIKGLSIWYIGIHFPDEQEGIYVTDEYRSYAEQLCQYLKTFENLGVKKQVISAYYDSGVPSYRFMRTVKFEDDFALDALILRKGSVTIGFNLNDKGLFVY